MNPNQLQADVAPPDLRPENAPAPGPLRLGVSACLLGNLVRYDGGHRRHEFIADVLARQLELVPICPEMEAGFGAPRETMRLTGHPARPRLVTTETGIDHTERMEHWVRQRVQGLAGVHLCGLILKSGSPSCGLKGVKVHQDSGAVAREGSGLFAQALTQHLPHLPLIDEKEMNDPALRDDFLQLVLRIHAAQQGASCAADNQAKAD